MQARMTSMEDGKEARQPAVAAAGAAQGQTRVFPTGMLKVFLGFLLIGVGLSAFGMYMARHTLAAAAPALFRPCLGASAATEEELERWTRPPARVRHAMTDEELLWRASFAPRVRGYPFRRVPKVAFMFLTCGPLPLAPLWERFFRGHEGRYSIYIHALPSYHANFTSHSSSTAAKSPSQIGGKLLVFQSTLPSLGIGRLRLRGDDVRAYGTDKEHTLRVPEDPFYKQMAAEFTKNQIAVDIFSFSEKYCDIASLGSLAKYTGGQVYLYPSFQAATHGEKLKHELSRDLTRETAWESVMRIRCGKGVRFTTYHGHFMLRSTTDLLALPAVDSDKAFAMQLSLEETLMTTQTVYFQVALLYPFLSMLMHYSYGHAFGCLLISVRKVDVTGDNLNLTMSNEYLSQCFISKRLFA